MKRILLLLLFGLGVFSAQSQITVDNTQTVQQLVDDVLILGECAEVNNITSPNNSSVGGDPFDSFGAFDGTTSTPPFPFDSGIVLATNGVDMIPTGNPNQGGGFNWAGDADLAALIQEPGNTNNATVIEFDFIPFVDEINFNYLLASNEWQTFVCNFADTFAFILSGPGISDVNDYNHDANPNTPDVTLDLGGQNIAVIPGTNIPVNPTNIHDLSTTCGAGQLGEFAIPQLFDSASLNDGTTFYNARTVPLTASADVIPGQTYTIKLAIADRGDTAFDSAVFLESASFDLGGIDLGPDITIENGTAACEGDTVILDAGFSAANIQYFWAQDGNIIPGENEQTLEVTEGGVYEVGIQIGAGGTACFGVSNAVTIEFFPEPTFDPNVPIDLCEGDTLTLDGTPTNAAVYTSIDYQWFKDGIELTGETNPILVVDEGGQYQVIIDANACDDVPNTFDVNLIDYQVSLPVPPDTCIGTGETVEIIPDFTGLTPDEINQVSYAWSTGETTPTIELSAGDTITLTTTFNGCDETATETFTFFNNPEVNIDGSAILCEGETITLDATPSNEADLNSTDFTWSKDGNVLTGENNATLDITEAGIYEVIVDNNGCITTNQIEVSLVDYQVSLPIPLETCIGAGETVEIVPDFTGLTQDEINQVSYAWSTGETTPTIELDDAGTVTLITTFEGCEESVTETFTFFNNPEVDIAGVSTLCDGETNTLDATPLNLSELQNPTYVWTLDGTVLPGETNPTLDITEGGLYEVVVVNNDCPTTAQFEVDFVSYTLELGNDENLCTGDGGPENIIITPNITGLTSAQENQILYSWSDGSTEETLTVTESGTFTLETNVNECIQTDEITISIVETLDVILADAVKCPEDEVVLNTGLPDDNPDVTYSWTLDGEPITGEDNPSITADQEGTYVITVNNQGCPSSATAEVSNYNVDNCVITQGISPNEDGFNDCMDLTWLNDQLGIDRFRVFNRYGRKVFDETNYEDTFCGQDDDGDELSTGTYFYVIDLAETDQRFERVVKGWVYINLEQ